MCFCQFFNLGPRKKPIFEILRKIDQPLAFHWNYRYAFCSHSVVHRKTINGWSIFMKLSNFCLFPGSRSITYRKNMVHRISDDMTRILSCTADLYICKSLRLRKLASEKAYVFESVRLRKRASAKACVCESVRLQKRAPPKAGAWRSQAPAWNF